MNSATAPAHPPLRVSGDLIALSTWRNVGFCVVIGLFILKGIQGCLENAVASPLEFLVYAFKCRITNVSLWFVVFGFISIWIIAGLVPSCAKTGFWIDGLHLQNGWIAFVLILSTAEIGLYLSAAFRDGGTFFIQIDWGHDRTLSMGVYAIQVIEGIIDCILLSILSFWASVAHAAVSELRIWTSNEGVKASAEMCDRIVWVTLFPVLSLAGLSAAKIVIDWKTGIANAGFAVATALLMWSVFFCLMWRLISLPCIKVVPAWTIPFFRIEPR